MTKEPCSYCGEHHHYREVANMVCDNVRTLYPLWDNRIEQKEAHTIATDYFTEEIKALKNDYMVLNTSRLNALTVAQKAWQERDMALNELKIAKRELWKLKNPNKMYTANSQE